YCEPSWQHSSSLKLEIT
ncbi:hypothetical protein A2U01_0105803, partial [Trifolium medium]|nr:hypothetical protein [Trifolium medium]